MNEDLEFKPFAKMNRFHDETMFITEKIDGTNAQILIYERNVHWDEDGVTHDSPFVRMGENGKYIIKRMRIGSRSRWISPGKDTDNFGFAGWCKEHEQELLKLPLGRHYGEWWGKGIQRGYDVPEKRLSLFNQSLHEIKTIIPCIDFAPLLYTGAFDLSAISSTMAQLKNEGSKASPGFMDPEGVVVYLKKSGIFFKRTFDDKHKWEQVA